MTLLCVFPTCAELSCPRGLLFLGALDALLHGFRRLSAASVSRGSSALGVGGRGQCGQKEEQGNLSEAHFMVERNSGELKSYSVIYISNATVILLATIFRAQFPRDECLRYDKHLLYLTRLHLAILEWDIKHARRAHSNQVRKKKKGPRCVALRAEVLSGITSTKIRAFGKNMLSLVSKQGKINCGGFKIKAFSEH